MEVVHCAVVAGVVPCWRGEWAGHRIGESLMVGMMPRLMREGAVLGRILEEERNRLDKLARCHMGLDIEVG